MKQQNFSELFEGSSDGILITDDKTEIVYHNSIILGMLPNIPKTPSKNDFSNLINLDCILDEEISYNLFELDHLILTTKKNFSIGNKK